MKGLRNIAICRVGIEAGVPALVLAPMEGVTDAPMRTLLTERGGFSLCVTEFLTGIVVTLNGEQDYTTFSIARFRRVVRQIRYAVFPEGGESRVESVVGARQRF